MKELINKFSSLKGASFVSLNGYVSASSGEVADVVINCGISVENAKKTDLNRLENCTPEDLVNVSNASGIAVDTVKQAHAEMLASAIKNLNPEISERSAQSQGQTDAYVQIAPGLKLHKETLALHIFAMNISKKVIVKGEYKTVNSSAKTLAKKAIGKYLDLRSDKFRNYIIGNMDAVTILGDTFTKD